MTTLIKNAGQSRRPVLIVLSLALAAALLIFSGCASRKKSSQVDVKQAKALRALAEAYVAEGKYRPALFELKKAEAANPKDADVQYDKGLVYLTLGQPKLAVEAFKHTLEINPDYVVAMNSLGASYMAMDQWDEAIPWFEKLLDNLLYATPQYPHLNLGWCYYNKKDYVKSFQAYKTALEYDPDFPEAMRGMGRTLTAMGRYPEAIRYLETTVEKTPGFLNAWFDLGVAYKRSGRGKQARKAFAKIIEEAPGTPLAQKARLEMGQRI